jgi:hypothetical protein
MKSYRIYLIDITRLSLHLLEEKVYTFRSDSSRFLDDREIPITFIAVLQNPDH